jgi:hypothetical protein
MEARRARVRLESQPAPIYVAFESAPSEGERITTAHGPATVEALVDIQVTRVDPGRCAICRDNARTRFVVKQSDAHGVKKWCELCLRDRLAIDPRAVEGTAP